jgi:hypothetical protein
MGPASVILAGEKSSENRRDSVALVLVDGRLQAVDAVPQMLRTPPMIRAIELGLDLFGEVNRPLYVGEKHS